jgi:hypothetical protein
MSRVFTDTGDTSGLQTVTQTVLSDLATWSVSFWMQRKATPGGTRAVLGIIGGGTNGWIIKITAANLLQAQVFGSGDVIRASTTAPTLDVFQHVLITWAGGTASTGFTFYFDGIAEAGTNVSTPLSGHTAGSAPFAIGTPFGANSVGPYWIGPVAVWNNELSASHALFLAGGGHPMDLPEGLLFYTAMDGGMAEADLVNGFDLTPASTGNAAIENNPRTLMLLERADWDDDVYVAAAGGSSHFRRTLSELGTRGGSRRAA